MRHEERTYFIILVIISKNSKRKHRAINENTKYTTLFVYNYNGLIRIYNCITRIFNNGRRFFLIWQSTTLYHPCHIYYNAIFTRNQSSKIPTNICSRLERSYPYQPFSYHEYLAHSAFDCITKRPAKILILQLDYRNHNTHLLFLSCYKNLDRENTFFNRTPQHTLVYSNCRKHPCSNYGCTICANRNILVFLFPRILFLANPYATYYVSINICTTSSAITYTITFYSYCTTCSKLCRILQTYTPSRRTRTHSPLSSPLLFRY